ncbi:hypothetical protein COEREDRAFT_9252 [Coemansia reversa NRRL 1564]|uniref:Uncharacterized protein n=1 Tax=Coemansia reversa (strain ATCC 12441 / NRRL 1564) TaxID=763665 RepID=A0A2G5B960_COERN|nr:hypothetical protein COEREDRAFT_9252 [Coemansia reversa NRRL 1564]|eukprot:PIA15548.1 hypothetical protein COEREDRAFT_9252 [Coemansia reversa NRRL 1564]
MQQADDNDHTDSVKRLFDPVTGKLTVVSHQNSRRTLGYSTNTGQRTGFRGRGGNSDNTKSKDRRGNKGRNPASVVPRILVRSDRTTEQPTEQQQEISLPVVESTRKSSKSRTVESRSTTEAFLPWSPAATIRLPAVSSTGKLLGTSVRRSLGTLQTRLSIGVLGRSATGKSLLLSQLAQSPWTAQHTTVFPSNNKESTLGIDLWPTPAGIMLVDTPPVLNLHAADRWTHRDTSISKTELARVHNLQITLLLLQVCDSLLVVVDAARLLRGKNLVDMTPNDWVDVALAKLLMTASMLAKAIPGFSQPATPQKLSGCRIHVVLSLITSNFRTPAHAVDREAIAHAYESATGIAVTNVSLLPRNQSTSSSDELRFLSIAESWSSSAAPLYSTLQSTGKKCRSLLPPRLLASRKNNKNNGSINFEESVAEIRNLLLGTVPTGKWWMEGAWASTFLRSWDSIRRSDLLHESAIAPDSFNNIDG